MSHISYKQFFQIDIESVWFRKVIRNGKDREMEKEKAPHNRIYKYEIIFDIIRYVDTIYIRVFE